MTTDATCPHCGEGITLPEVTGAGKRVLTCGCCQARLEVIVSFDGGETLFQPQLLAQGLPDPPAAPPGPAAGDATRPVGSATTRLEPAAGGEKRDVTTVARACLVISGALPGSERLGLTADRTVVGREGADHVVADGAVSSRHFEVERRGAEYFLRDLGSSNGTFVNGHRVRAVQLRPGDAIRAGSTTFTFRVFEVIAL
jgi:FHA domain